jgi:hypothetical protein
MFGHLKAENLMNLIEGSELPPRSLAHLKACRECSDALASAKSFHAEMAASVTHDEEIPEPDWFQFRADIRNSMLSRAAQRQSKSTFWSGWMLRPAMSWGLAVAFAAGLSAGLLIWHRPAAIPETTQVANVVSPDQTASVDGSDSSNIPDDVSIDSGSVDSDLTSWSDTSVFEELSQLNDAQSEKLQRLLEADAGQAPVKQ